MVFANINVTHTDNHKHRSHEMHECSSARNAIMHAGLNYHLQVGESGVATAQIIVPNGIFHQKWPLLDAPCSGTISIAYKVIDLGTTPLTLNTQEEQVRIAEVRCRSILTLGSKPRPPKATFVTSAPPRL